MIKSLFKSIVVAALVYSPCASLAGEGILDSNEAVTAIRGVLDKTLSNPVVGAGGSEASVTYSMTSEEVCKFLDTSDTEVCNTISQNLKIEQRVYSDVKGNVAWILGYYKLIEMNYDTDKVDFSLAIGAIHSIVGSANLSALFKDASPELASFIPDAGKIKLSVETVSTSNNIVKFEITEKIEHTVQINSEDVYVKLPAGMVFSLNADEINQIVSAGWKMDGLKLSLPAGLSPTGSSVVFENNKLSGELTLKALIQTISGQTLQFDTVSLKIDGNQAALLHASLPTSFSAKFNESPLIQILNNNVNITLNVNTDLVDSALQGDYRVALSKDDSLSAASDGVTTLNINNLVLKAPTAALRNLASLPLSPTAVQTQLSASKFKLQGYAGGNGINFQSVELKNIVLADDGIAQASLNHSGNVNFIYTPDEQNGGFSTSLAGLKNLDVDIKTNFINQVLGQGEVLDANKTLSLAVDRVDGQFISNKDGSYEVKQVKLSEDGETGHIVIALDETPLFDLSQTGVIDFAGIPQETGFLVTFNTAVSADFEIFSNPLLPVGTFHSAITAGTVATFNDSRDVLVNNGQFIVTSNVLQGDAFCSPSNQVGACQLELVHSEEAQAMPSEDPK